ncbi:MAG: SRPBCC family protein [Planctomycetota bacterium]
MSVTVERATTRKGWLLKADFVVPRPIDEVFPFFADAYELERITPPILHFSVLTPKPIEMREGLTLDYKLKLRGIPIRWRSLISAWEPNRRFVDEQLKGPYSWWHHEHLFEEVDDGTRVIDNVHYGVPGGAIINALLVEKDVKNIFEYRQRVMAEIFAARPEPLSV